MLLPRKLKTPDLLRGSSGAAWGSDADADFEACALRPAGFLPVSCSSKDWLKPVAMMVTLMIPSYASSTTAPKMMLHDASAMPVTTCSKGRQGSRLHLDRRLWGAQHCKGKTRRQPLCGRLRACTACRTDEPMSADCSAVSLLRPFAAAPHMLTSDTRLTSCNVMSGPPVMLYTMPADTDRKMQGAGSKAG